MPGGDRSNWWRPPAEFDTGSSASPSKLPRVDVVTEAGAVRRFDKYLSPACRRHLTQEQRDATAAALRFTHAARRRLEHQRHDQPGTSRPRNKGRCMGTGTGSQTDWDASSSRLLGGGRGAERRRARTRRRQGEALLAELTRVGEKEQRRRFKQAADWRERNHGRRRGRRRGKGQGPGDEIGGGTDGRGAGGDAGLNASPFIELTGDECARAAATRIQAMVRGVLAQRWLRAKGRAEGGDGDGDRALAALAEQITGMRNGAFKRILLRLLALVRRAFARVKQAASDGSTVARGASSQAAERASRLLALLQTAMEAGSVRSAHDAMRAAAATMTGARRVRGALVDAGASARASAQSTRAALARAAARQKLRLRWRKSGLIVRRALLRSNFCTAEEARTALNELNAAFETQLTAEDAAHSAEAVKVAEAAETKMEVQPEIEATTGTIALETAAVNVDTPMDADGDATPEVGTAAAMVPLRMEVLRTQVLSIRQRRVASNAAALAAAGDAERADAAQLEQTREISRAARAAFDNEAEASRTRRKERQQAGAVARERVLGHGAGSQAREAAVAQKDGIVSRVLQGHVHDAKASGVSEAEQRARDWSAHQRAREAQNDAAREALEAEAEAARAARNQAMSESRVRVDAAIQEARQRCNKAWSGVSAASACAREAAAEAARTKREADAMYNAWSVQMAARRRSERARLAKANHEREESELAMRAERRAKRAATRKNQARALAIRGEERDREKQQARERRVKRQTMVGEQLRASANKRHVEAAKVDAARRRAAAAAREQLRPDPEFRLPNI